MIGVGFLLRVFSFMFYFALALILLLAVYAVVGYGIRAFLYVFGVQTKDHVKWLFSKFPKRRTSKRCIPCELCKYVEKCDFSFTSPGVSTCQVYYPKGYKGDNFSRYLEYLRGA